MAEYRDPWAGGSGNSHRAPHASPPFGPSPEKNTSPPPERWRAPPGFGGMPPRPAINPYKRPLRRNANILGAGLTLCFIIPAFGYFTRGFSPVVRSIFGMSLNILMLLVPAILIAVWLNMPFRVAFPIRRASARLTVPGVFCCLGTSVIGVYISMVLAAILAGTVGVAASMPDFSPPRGAVEIVIYIIMISVIPAIFEELLCRGVVMQSLRRFGDGFAVVTSSLLFAMLHRNLLQGPNAFITGMLLGYFTLRSGSLIPAIVMHFFNNFIYGMLSVVMLNIPVRYAQILNFSLIPAFLGLGVVGVILMALLNGGFLPLHNKDIGLGSGQKCRLFFTAPLAILFILATVYQSRHFFNFI